MKPKKRTRPSREKRSALKAASSPQASAPGAAETGKTPSSPVPRQSAQVLARFSRRDALAALALGLLTGVCYLPAMLWGGFVWDDFIWFQSRAVQEWSGLGDIWSWPSRIHREIHYWPLTYTTFWLEHKMWGLEPAGYHAVNVLLHLLNSLLVWRLLLRLAVPGAWVAAAVFALHPTHVESVAWIIERKDVLSGLFYLAAVLAWLRFLEQPRPWRYGLALLLFAAGLLSKSIVVTLPAALLILQWWKSGRITARDLQRVAPFFLVGLIITALDLYSVGSKSSLLDYSLPERMLIAAQALWFYAGKLVWPAELAIIYPLWDISLADSRAWLALAGAAGLAAVLWFLRHRIGRGPLAGALFFAVTLSPVLGFVNHGYMDYSLVADRFQYLAGIGVMAVLIGVAVHGAGRLPGRLKLGAAGLAVVVLALLGTMTWRQAGVYRDKITFFSHIVSLNPEARDAHFNLSHALGVAGRTEEALAPALMAVEQRPDDARALCMLGSVLIHLDRFAKAEETLGRALEIDPDHKCSRREMAHMLRMQGRHQEALEAYRALLEIYPNYPLAYFYTGNTLVQLQRYEEAVEPLSKALTMTRAATSVTAELPKPVFVHVLLGTALRELGRTGAAEAHFRQALQLDPRNTSALDQVAAAHFRRKRFQEAFELYRTLREIDPEAASTHADIGVTLYYLNRTKEAIRSLERALALDPSLETARTNLEEIRKRIGQSIHEGALRTGPRRNTKNGEGPPSKELEKVR